MDIYVGNLAPEVNDQELKVAFEAFGGVTTARIIKDRQSGQPKGFGFVEMPVMAEAQAAIKAMNGKEIGGRPLTVNEARPREERRPGPGAGGGGRW